MKKLILIVSFLCSALCLKAAVTQSVQIDHVDSFGSLVGPDGKDWFYTENFTPSSEFDYAYGAAEISIYDDNMSLALTLRYDVPAGVKCNLIEPFGQVTQKFFDYKENTYEVMLYVHSLGEYNTNTSSFTQINENYIFSGARGGEASQIMKFDCQNLAIVDASQGYDVNQRLCAVYQEGDTLKADIYKRGNYSSTISQPVLEHTFSLNFDNANYVDGSWFNTYAIDGQIYYAISYYEKPYAAGLDENYEIILMPDNYFVTEVYGQNFEKAMNVRLSAVPSENSPYTLHGVGRFGEDLTKGYYTGDDQLNLVVGFNDYIIASDDSEYTFKVYNAAGEEVKTIFSGAETWNFLSDIPGQESQVGILRTKDEVSEIVMIDLPSCQEVAVLPSVINNHKLNWNFDRMAVGPTEYQYAFALNEGEIDETNKEALGLIGWYTTAGEEVRIDRLNVGKDGVMFLPLFSGDYPLSAYLYNTDDKIEYPYITKVTRTGSTVVDNALRIANQEGEIVQEYVGDDEDALASASFLNYKGSNPVILIFYKNNESGKFTITAETLPYSRFEAGGKGTESEPYIISTPGDLLQMGNIGNGYFVLANDLDMASTGRSYLSPTNFSGSFDGQNHTIRNLYIDNADIVNAGLFGTVVKHSNYAVNTIQNLTLSNPIIETGKFCNYAGAMVGWAQGLNIINCFVDNARIEAHNGAAVGGLVGSMGTQSDISLSGLFGSEIVTSNSGVGGIVGKAIYASCVSQCAVVDSHIEGIGSVGGIMGESSQDNDNCAITDCHVKAQIFGQNAVGGVIGYSARNHVTRNFVELTGFGAQLDTRDNKYSAGGIVGYAQTDWAKNPAKDIYTANVVVAGEEAGDIWGDIAGKDAWHRIIGFTAQDEEYSASETPKTERGADKNFADVNLSANGAKGEQTPDGADVAALTSTFFTELGYCYGNEVASPWKDNNGRPALFFEETHIANGIEEITNNEPSTLHDGVFLMNGLKANTNAKGILIIIKDGKTSKIIK